MDCSIPGFPVYHQLPDLAQTHVHCISDAIQPSHPLLSPSPPAFSSIQLLSRVWLFVTPWTAVRQASLSITNSQSPPKPMSIVSVMPSNHLILCRPLLLLPSIFPSISLFKWVSSLHQVAKVLEFQLQHQSLQWTPRTDLLLPSIFPSIRVLSSELVLCIRWPKYWSLSLNISPSNEYSGLISFRIDWFHLLEIQGTLKNSSPTPQFKSINSLAFSHLYGSNCHIHTWLLEKP